MSGFQEWEFNVLDWIANSFINNALFDNLMPVASALGDMAWFWWLAAVILFSKVSTRKVAISMVLALVGSLLISTYVLTPATPRERPFEMNPEVTLLVVAPTDNPFPDAHTQASFAAASAIFFLKKKLGFLALALAAFIAFSRLYLYVNFPTDVLAGAAIGFALGTIAFQFVKGLLKRSRNGGRGNMGGNMGGNTRGRSGANSGASSGARGRYT